MIAWIAMRPAGRQAEHEVGLFENSEESGGDNMSVNVRELLEQKCCNNIAACTDEQIYYGLLGIVKDLAKEKESNEGKKKIYYISAEFLIGGVRY